MNVTQVNRIKESLCIDCGGSLNGRFSLRCNSCTYIASQRNEVRRQKLIKNKQCVGCMQFLDKNEIAQLCKTCYEKSKPLKYAFKEKRIQAGICIRCSNVNDNKNADYCKKCSKKMIVRAVIRKKNQPIIEGICRYCKNPAIEGRVARCCEKCWFKSIAASTTGTRKNWEMLKEILVKQDYKCAYTHMPLVISVNASLDHKIPPSRGGNNSKENLQWVDWNVNMMKNNLLHKEFIERSKIIYLLSEGIIT